MAHVLIAKLEPHTNKVQEEQIKKKRKGAGTPGGSRSKQKRREMDELERQAHPAGVLDLAEAD